MGKHKRPTSRFSPQKEKKPRVDPAAFQPSGKPMWRVSMMDMYGPFGWGAVSAEDLRLFWSKLRDFESMNWQEIGQHGSHYVDVASCSPEARARLKEIKQDDLEQIDSLRLTGPKRVYGIREMNCLRILWWDPRHQVYPAAE